MDKKHFISLLQYDRWANKKIADVLAGSENLPAKCKLLFHHIGATLDLWFVRLTGAQRYFGTLFAETDPELTFRVIEKNLNRWLVLLNKDDTDIEQTFSYINTKGKKFESSILDVLTHLYSHNHYHRGQINQLLRQNNIEPASIDYIFYMRE